MKPDTLPLMALRLHFPLPLATCHHHGLCLLQRTRPSPCSRDYATGRWGLAPAPCLWPSRSPSRYAAAAVWAKHGAASVRSVPCLAQVIPCPHPSSGFQGASSKSVAIFPSLGRPPQARRLLVFPPCLSAYPSLRLPPSLLPQLSHTGREGEGPGFLQELCHSACPLVLALQRPSGRSALLAMATPTQAQTSAYP